MELTTHSGARVAIGDLIASGGRGRVFDLVECPNVAVKLFERSYATEGRRRKLAEMIRMGKPAGMRVAWPIEIVSDNQGNFAGYAMRRLSGPTLREVANDPDASIMLRLELAAMMTSDVVRAHNAGVVVGDLSLNNFVFDSESRRVVLIDADSVQFFGEDGVKYTTDEARGRSAEMAEHGLGTWLSSRSDDELLAEALFELIFGRSPYYEFAADMLADEIEAKNKRNRRFPYLDETWPALPLDFAGIELGLLFMRAFASNDTPAAEDFHWAFKMIKAKGMAECGTCGYPHRADIECPSCAFGLSAA